MGFFDLFRKKESPDELNRQAMAFYSSGQYAAAADCARKSADTGDFRGMFLYAAYLKDGKGVQKNMKRAFELMTKAAESGYVEAQRELGLMHLDGTLYGNETMKALGANIATALEWFEKAGNQGDAEAQYQMGFLLGAGADGDPQLMKESYDWLAKAADQGHEKAIKMCEDILAIIEGE